ncbi:hypothetical protein [Thermoactinospora rubra]|uniref:hypothetical protein n=1 Tax=Thermoactinospora rubra TaxID=1088767 RepID=UPI000A0FFB4C|nr:hypothetical protein [Thermoactinospora rubra]
MDEDQTPSPEETLRIIERQEAATFRQLVPNPLVVYTPWGLAWIVGFVTYFLATGLDGTPIVTIPWQVCFAVLMGAQVLAGVVMGAGLSRSSLQIKGRSSQQGMMYGFAWFVGMVAMGAIGSHFVTRLPDSEIPLLFTTVSLLVVGVLYMAGAAVWTDWRMFLLGAWTAIVDGVAATVGGGLAYLMIAVLVGGAFTAVGIVYRHRAA